MIIGHVAGRPVPESVVDDRVAVLRAGPYAALLPNRGKESRQLRRWVGHLVLAETVCEAAATRLGLAPVDEPIPLDDVAAMELGSLAAAVLSGSPCARAVYRALVRGVPDAQARDYYRRNVDRFRTAEALATGGDAVLPYHAVRTVIVERLRAAAARRRFRAWLDGQIAALVEPSPGWEHPGDPRQPDNTHRH